MGTACKEWVLALAAVRDDGVVRCLAAFLPLLLLLLPVDSRRFSTYGCSNYSYKQKSPRLQKLKFGDENDLSFLGLLKDHSYKECETSCIYKNQISCISSQQPCNNR
jgi:hypothetical protein